MKLYGQVIPRSGGVAEMQRCPLYVGVVSLRQRHEKSKVHLHEFRYKGHVTRNLARAQCPWGVRRIARHHGSPNLVSTA
jgi:hypothetical protein